MTDASVLSISRQVTQGTERTHTVRVIATSQTVLIPKAVMLTNGRCTFISKEIPKYAVSGEESTGKTTVIPAQGDHLTKTEDHPTKTTTSPPIKNC